MTAATIEAMAIEALAAFDAPRQIAPFTARAADFDVGQAYAVTAAIRRLRTERGEIPAGRKIGFTNRTIWTTYNVDCPIWGDMYETSIHQPNAAVFSLARFSEPQIEPEIALRLSRAPDPGMDERALLDCIEWVSHGFEIVQSIFPDWKFKLADTVAGFGMHGAFLLGPPTAVKPQSRDAWFDALRRFTVVLIRNGNTVDSGEARNVLDGPLTALRHLVALLARDPHNPPLRAGEIVTTGTLTRAFPVKAGETWSTQISGIDLPGLDVRFG